MNFYKHTFEIRSCCALSTGCDFQFFKEWMANRSPEQNDAVNKAIVNMCTGVSKLNLNKRSDDKSKGSFSKC